MKFNTKIQLAKSAFLGLLTLSMFTACSSDDSDDNYTDVTNPGPTSGVITGDITADKTYEYGNYTLIGIVKVQSGVTVTFKPGSTITCDKTVSPNNALVVLQGGKLVTEGTADAPVVFTETSKTPGSWGGIILYGNAPVKVAGGGSSSTSEDGNNISYGGDNAADNSGSLVYTRVEYAGAKLNDGEKENNGFTFYAVGSGTHLDHLVSYRGADDGYEFFGGTVSLTNAISWGNYDDAFDWQDGWQGQLNSNWLAYQNVKGNFGMEIEASSNDNAYWPVISNITLIRAAGTVPEVGDNQVDAIQFKKEGNGVFDNVVVSGYGTYTTSATPPVAYDGAVIRIEDNATLQHQVLTSKIKVTNVKVSATAISVPVGRDTFEAVVFPAASFTINASAAGASLNPGAWATVSGASLLP